MVLGTSHCNNRGDLVPPPPPAYLDIFPERPSLTEEVQSFSDSNSEVGVTPPSNSVQQSNEISTSQQAVVTESAQSVIENIQNRNSEIRGKYV